MSIATEDDLPLSPPVASTARSDRELGDRRLANKAIAISAVGLGLTGVIELIVALVSGSVALLSDALHNLSDVSTSAVVFFGFQISKRAPTPRYPYGYRRAEDVAGLGVALVIWLSALLAGYQSVTKLINGTGTSYVILGIAAAAVGVIGNLLVARYKLRVGRRIHSTALVADADHSRLDALSSVGAMVGLILVALGFPIGDPIAGLAVTILIIEVGFEVTKDVLHHLLDGIEPDLLASIATTAAEAPGVERVLRTRGRWMGRVVQVDLELRLIANATLDDYLTAEAWIKERVAADHEMVNDVLVAVRP